jgi:hypothetical protein
MRTGGYSVAMPGNRALPLPPYGHFIDQTQSLVMIYCGARAWKLAPPAQDRVASLIFPTGRDASEYRWPVAHKNVLVIAQARPRQEVEILAVELLRAGADTVYLDLGGDNDVLRYENPRAAACAR